MTSWLLLHMSTWQLAAVVIGGTVAVALAGCLGVRRRFPAVSSGNYTELSGVLLGIFAAIYGVLLAFVIVILWEGRDRADAAVADETAALSQVVQDSRGLAPTTRDALQATTGGYVRVVVDQEWPAMAHGAGSQATADALDRAMAVLRERPPGSDAEGAYYQDALSSLNQVATSRRARLVASAEGLPGLLGTLIVVGAAVFVPLTYLFGVARPAMQLVFVGFCAALVAVGLFLTVVLDRPFTGALGLTPTQYHLGELAQFWSQT